MAIRDAVEIFALYSKKGPHARKKQENGMSSLAGVIHHQLEAQSLEISDKDQILKANQTSVVNKAPVEYVQASGRPCYYFRLGTAHLNRMVQTERGGECGPTRDKCPTRDEEMRARPEIYAELTPVS
ncbi:hypothetical protein WN944_022283 [Citrus x changshan-huyou]|uniref:Uncharacterized protein n=1 Tax=Citrus x changshan-huyou TaxID=2935761 RepID=A0AAP0R343_9ROSI